MTGSVAMKSRRVYLDYNASAPMDPIARETFLKVAGEAGNASSIHTEGRRAHGYLETARADVTRLLKAPGAGVVFTSGGTEANNLAIAGLSGRGAISRIFVSAIEHDCVLAAAEASGVRTETIPVLANGVVNVDALAARLSKPDCEAGDFLVCVMHANNETGVVQPVEAVAAVVHERGGRLLVDAAQTVGKRDVDMVNLGADMLSFAGHKFGAPQGVGALVFDPNLKLDKQIHGGGQELGRRAGTENVAAVAAMGVVLKARAGADDGRNQATRLEALKDRLETKLHSAAPEGVVYGASAERLPNTTCFAAPGFAAETQVLALDLAGYAISAGSACSSGKVKRSHVLAAMGAPDSHANSAIRISFGSDTTEADIDGFVDAWAVAYRRAVNRPLAEAV